MTDINVEINVTGAPIDIGTITVGSHGNMEKAVYDINNNGIVDSSEDLEIPSLTAKTTPVDADLFVGTDSDATNTRKKFTWANIKATLKTYFDGFYILKSLFDANTILAADTDDTPAALTVTEQTLVGRATGGNIAAIAIDSDLSSVSDNDDTIPSAKATKAMGDLKVVTTDIVDDLTTGGSAVPLSAEQGKVLQDGLQFEATNLVSNGDFSSGTTGWAAFNGSAAVSNNTYSITGNGTSRFVFTEADANAGNTKYYVKIRIKINNSNCSSFYVHFLGRTSGGNFNFISQLSPIKNLWYEVSSITDITNTVGDTYIRVVQEYVDAATANNEVMEVQYVSVIDLTASFGAGNEPSVEEMDAIMALYDNSWFDGTTDIQYVDQIIARLQTKADTVQEDWIEPTLLNSWVNFGSPYFDTGYYKNNVEEVKIVATVKDGTTTTSTNIFSLAAGYRPANDQYFVCASNGVFGLVIVRADGDVEIQTANATYLSLDGISFKAEA